jgi:hypothetical protein
MKIDADSDHAGFRYNERIILFLREKRHQVLDFGPDSTESVDYPTLVSAAGEERGSDIRQSSCFVRRSCQLGPGSPWRFSYTTRRVLPSGEPSTSASMPSRFGSQPKPALLWSLSLRQSNRGEIDRVLLGWRTFRIDPSSEEKAENSC